MRTPKMMRLLMLVWLAGVFLLLPAPAQAHWCTNIWDTPARLVVKPERSTVFVDPGPEDLVVYVRNNFPYTISGVQLTGENSDFDVSSSPSDAVIQPGENKKYTLTLTRVNNSGDDNLYLKISIGNGHIPDSTPPPGPGQDIATGFTTQVLPSASDINGSDGQAAHSKWQKFTELQSTYPSYNGLQTMLNKYCQPRLMYTSGCDINGGGGGYDGSWHVSDHGSVNGYTDCFNLWAFDYKQAQRALMDLAIIHKSDQSVQDAYITGMDDPMPLWRGLCAVLAAAFTPGSNVQTRIETMASSDTCVNASNCSNYSSYFSASNDAKELAKAALIILGQTQYQNEVNTYCYGGHNWESYVCAAALGIAGQDGPVTDILLPNTQDTADPEPEFVGYLVGLVAAYRRGPTDTGCVSFFGENCQGDTTPPQAPQNLKVVAAP